MELETSNDVALRLPALVDVQDSVGNLTTNLTNFSSEIANYSINFFDVGILASTAATVARVATNKIISLSSSSSTPAAISISTSSTSSTTSIIPTATPNPTTTTTTTRTATTPLSLSSLTASSSLSSSSSSSSLSSSSLKMLDSSIPPSILHATETVYATLAHNIANVITPTIYPLNGHTTMTMTMTTTAVGAAAAAAAAVEATTTTTSTSTTITNEMPITGNDVIRLEHAPQLSKSAMVKVYVLSVMAFLSLLGNIMTMWNIYKTRLARRSSRHSWSAIYSLIFHLSIADVLVTFFCIIGEAAWCYTVQWLADEITCKLVKLFQMFSLYLSTYVLVLIGVDRWIAVKYPMKSLNMAKRCYRLLGGTYVLSFLLSLPQFFIFHVARGPFIEEFYQCVTHGFYTAEWQEQLYATFTLVFTFLLPLFILFCTYLSSFRTIASSEKMFQGSKLTTYSSKPSTQTNRQRLIHKAKMKSLRISVVIIFAFLICWTPYYVMMIIFMFWNPDKRFGEDLQSAIFFFGMSNSLVNPLIYGAFHLCPMKRKASKYSNNNPHSLNRGDSQRTPSMLTAVTQVDGHGRQVRTFRPSYYRTQSNCSNSNNYKEQVSLLQVTPTPSILRKGTNQSIQSSSFRSNGKNGNAPNCSSSPHSTVLLSYDGGSSANSTINRRSSDSLSMQKNLLGKHFTSGCSVQDQHTFLSANENISSV